MEIDINQHNGNVGSVTRQIHNVIKEGGLSLFPDGVGYGLVGHSDESIKRIYELKGRSLTKPLTHYMDSNYASNISNIPNGLISKITQETPSCFVVPYKKSAYFDKLGDFALKQSTKEGTVALFFDNDDFLIKELLKLSLPDDFALIVSSANTSSYGNSYRFEEVPENIRRNVDIAIYSKFPCKYEPQAISIDKKLGSTLVKLPERKIIRSGINSDLISRLLKED